LDNFSLSWGALSLSPASLPHSVVGFLLPGTRFRFPQPSFRFSQAIAARHLSMLLFIHGTSA